MAASRHIPRFVQDASASTRLVYAALAERGPLTREEIIDETGVARRTANDALATLRDRGLAMARAHPKDHRRRLYSTTDR